MTTLETRVKVRRVMEITPSSEAGLVALLTENLHIRNLRKRLASDESVIPLSPKLSVHLLERLAELAENRGALHVVAASLSAPKHFRGPEALQEDVVHAALRTFGLAGDERALSLETVDGERTALARIDIIEDAAIEHDAKHVPGYDLVGSDLTGRAVFARGGEKLEVYTANRRPLEEVLGVDLIYLNVTRQNVVMLQYKMLESHKQNGETDWVYRPNKKLAEQIARMELFSNAHPPGPHEYRISSQVFYLKFVKRNGAIRSGGIIMPIDHFSIVRTDPACRGPRGAFRVSFDALGGRYLRQGPFLDLVRSGYVGAHATATSNLTVLVRAIIKDGHAVVAAVQSQATTHGLEDANGV
ncbi:MAG: hypothetical protein GKR94_04820 [Gammaproteobacteria bacterium]|nr:hypothetical protein [Gammaproteobacteria bacterium]